MSQKITCREAQQHLQIVTSLERELDRIFFLISEARDERSKQELKVEAGRIKIQLEEEVTFLVERANPFERLFNLQEQYQSQIYVLKTAKILEEVEVNGEKVRGFRDIEGEFHRVPTLKEVIGRLREKKELLETKKTQGFGKVRLVPFGISLEDLAAKHGQVLVSHAELNQLFTARKDRDDPNEEDGLLTLDRITPVSMSHEYKDADKNGNLVYHVTEFDKQNHGGRTKREILKERKEQHKDGWDIIVLENEVNIPKKGKGKTLGPPEKKRAQIEASKTPKQYLTLLQTPEYEGEVGLTPEEALMHAITELIENNEVIDEYQGNGSICYNIGAYFREGVSIWAASGFVPYSCFVRFSQQASLFRSSPKENDDSSGLRFGVRV